jgi:hypothetical protein
VPNCKTFLVTEAERKNVRRCVRAVIKRPLPQGKVLKEIHAILTETLGEHAPSYAFKHWVAQVKCGGPWWHSG